MTSAQTKNPLIFGEPHYVQNSFSIIFPRQEDIRLRLNDFERKLGETYGQPQIFNIPDDLEPEVPRAIFTARHGHSQIIVNQVSISVNVNYSLEWQTNTDLRREYLIKRASMVFDLVSLIKQGRKTVAPYFCGLSTMVRISSNASDVEIVEFISKLFNVDVDVDDVYDMQRKITKVVFKKYFSNITVENYRTWRFELNSLARVIVKFPRRDIKENGIQITGDYNDRFAFQERKAYMTSKSEVYKIIDQGLITVQDTFNQIKGET